MAFNLVDIISKFVPIRPHKSSADGWENPYATSAGQVVSSQQESFQSRLARLGSGKSSNAQNVPMTQGTGTSILSIRPSGVHAYFTHICISTTGAGMAYLNFYRQANGTSEIMVKYLPSAGSYQLDLDGSIMIGDGGQMTLMFKADGAGTSAYGTAHWLEVGI